jgi:hypothetical protein
LIPGSTTNRRSGRAAVAVAKHSLSAEVAVLLSAVDVGIVVAKAEKTSHSVGPLALALVGTGFSFIVKSLVKIELW